MSFECKVVAIAGAASGIGLATAHLLVSEGAKISLADIDLSIFNIKQTLPNPDPDRGNHICSVVDVRDPEAVNEWINSTVSTFGRLDGAVNMAGILTEAKPLAETSDEYWDGSFAVNARGTFNCLRAQIKAMSDGGSIVSTTVAPNITTFTYDSERDALAPAN